MQVLRQGLCWKLKIKLILDVLVCQCSRAIDALPIYQQPFHHQRGLKLVPTPAPSSMNLISSIDLSNLDGTNGFTLNGVANYDDSGYSVSSAGDFNNDGYDDVIIGSPNAVDYAGESYIVFGGYDVGISGVLELADLDGSNGFKLNGITAGDHSGFSVSGGFDFNKDGYDDVIIGAEDADGSGQVYVLYGSSEVGHQGSFNLSDFDGSNGFIIYGVDNNDQAGHSVSGAGDVNCDGYEDIIIGANTADPNGLSNSGESYIVFGGVGIASEGEFFLDDIDGTNGFVINGIDGNDQAGHSVSGAGDVNGDGCDDVLIGAYFAAPNGATFAGESYLVFGGTHVHSNGFELSALNGSNGFVLNGVDMIDFSGYSVAGAGDVNNDGMDDIIIGSPLADPNNNNYGGKSFVIFGSVDIGFNGSLDLSDVNGRNGFVINGIEGNDNSGYSVSGAGDVNGDRIDDIIIGARGADGSGASYVVYGNSQVGISGSFDLKDLNGTNGYVMYGVDSSDYCGESVSGAGDMNRDGYMDLIVGAHGADPDGKLGAGESYIVFGSATNTPFPTISPGPTIVPSPFPTRVPTPPPTAKPSLVPSPSPSTDPSIRPTPSPTTVPTPSPTVFPSQRPTELPTLLPSPPPTSQPTSVPSPLPTISPSIQPTAIPIPLPSSQPTVIPTLLPTLLPTSVPTIQPTPLPTLSPTPLPTSIPTIQPTSLPTPSPTPLPTSVPTSLPTMLPSIPPSIAPTQRPSIIPTPLPTQFPTPPPSIRPDYVPSRAQAASVTFIAAAFVQAVFCIGLGLKYSKNNITKRSARGESAAYIEQSKFHETHLNDLFGASALPYTLKHQNSRVDDNDCTLQFSTTMVDHMFAGLDLDGDGYISKADLTSWLSSQKIKSTKLRHSITTTELAAFFKEERVKGSGIDASKGLSRDDLGKCLERFDSLAFDWENPLQADQWSISLSTSKGMKRCLNLRDMSVEIFRRLDTDGDGWVKASDIRVWRRMLPIGRTEGKLVIALLSRASRLTSVQVVSRDQLLKEEDVGIKAVDLFITLREDPLLVAELSAQYTLLYYLLTGPDREDIFVKEDVIPKDESEKIIQPVHPNTTSTSVKFRLDDIGPLNTIPLNRYGNVPSESAISTFICIAKIKLCRLALAQHEIDTHQDTIVGDILKVLDVSKRGTITCSQLQHFLLCACGLKNLGCEDLALILGDMVLADLVINIEQSIIEDKGSTHSQNDKSLTTCNQIKKQGIAYSKKQLFPPQKHFDHQSLRQVLDRSTHHHLTSLLHCFITVTQRIATNRIIQSHKQKNEAIGSYKTNSALYDSAGSRAVFLPPFIGFDWLLQPPVELTRIEASTLFKLIESSVCTSEVICEEKDNFKGKEGYISAFHVHEWVKAAEGAHLISIRDIESLFQPDLPDFHETTSNSASLDSHTISKAFKAQKFDFHTKRTTARVEHVGVIGEVQTEYTLGDPTLEDYAQFIESVITKSPIAGGLNEQAFTCALSRRPYLSGCMALLMKQFKAIEASHYAEFAIGAAAAASTTLETVKMQIESDSTKVCYHVAYEKAAKHVMETAAAAVEATKAIHARLGNIGSHEIKELETLLVDAMAKDLYGEAVLALRKQLKEVRTRGARFELAILFVEVGLSIRLLQLREADAFPIQTQVLEALPPIKQPILPLVKNSTDTLPFRVMLPKVSLHETRPSRLSQTNANKKKYVNQTDKNNAFNDSVSLSFVGQGGDQINERTTNCETGDVEVYHGNKERRDEHKDNDHVYRNEEVQEGEKEEEEVIEEEEEAIVVTEEMKRKLKQLVKEQPVKIKELLRQIEALANSNEDDDDGSKSSLSTKHHDTYPSLSTRVPVSRLSSRNKTIEARNSTVNKRRIESSKSVLPSPRTSGSSRSPQPIRRGQRSSSNLTSTDIKSQSLSVSGGGQSLLVSPQRKLVSQASRDGAFSPKISSPVGVRRSLRLTSSNPPSKTAVKGMRRSHSVGEPSVQQQQSHVNTDTLKPPQRNRSLFDRGKSSVDSAIDGESQLLGGLANEPGTSILELNKEQANNGTVL